MSTTTSWPSIATELQLCAAAAAPASLPPGWALTDWGVGGLLQTQAIVAQQTGTSQYAIAIRGTQPKDIWNWILDFKTKQRPFEGISGAMISEGSHDGLELLLDAKGQNGVRLREYIDTLARQGVQLLVTGHSLGGNLASVMAAWIEVHTKLGANSHVATFAAPSAGNAVFANFFDTKLQSAAYFNQWDVVPSAWADLAHVKSLYQSLDKGGPKCPLSVSAYCDVEGPKFAAMYTQTNGSQQSGQWGSGLDWDAEVGFQHQISTYQALFT